MDEKIGTQKVSARIIMRQAAENLDNNQAEMFVAEQKMSTVEETNKNQEKQVSQKFKVYESAYDHQHGVGSFKSECWPAIVHFGEHKWMYQPKSIKNAKLMRIVSKEEFGGINWEAFKTQTRAFLEAYERDQTRSFQPKMSYMLNYFGHGHFTGATVTLEKVPSSDKEAVESEMLPDGRGIWLAVLDDEEGCCYIGDWKSGKRHGLGIMKG